jgi:hypothetical protein
VCILGLIDDLEPVFQMIGEIKDEHSSCNCVAPPDLANMQVVKSWRGGGGGCGESTLVTRLLKHRAVLLSCVVVLWHFMAVALVQLTA